MSRIARLSGGPSEPSVMRRRRRIGERERRCGHRPRPRLRLHVRFGPAERYRRDLGRWAHRGNPGGRRLGKHRVGRANVVHREGRPWHGRCFGACIVHGGRRMRDGRRHLRDGGLRHGSDGSNADGDRRRRRRHVERELVIERPRDLRDVRTRESERCLLVEHECDPERSHPLEESDAFAVFDRH